MGTPFRATTLPAAGCMEANAGLLAGREACCYRLDFKQLVYLFGLQWRQPEMETSVRVADGGRHGFRGFPQAGQWLRPYHRAHPVSASRPSLVAPVVCL